MLNSVGLLSHLDTVSMKEPTRTSFRLHCKLTLPVSTSSLCRLNAPWRSPYAPAQYRVGIRATSVGNIQ